MAKKTMSFTLLVYQKRFCINTSNVNGKGQVSNGKGQMSHHPFCSLPLTFSVMVTEQYL